MDRSQTQGWHLDKRVPLAFIFAIFVQTVVAAGAFYQLKYQVETHEMRIAKIETDVEDQKSDTAVISERTARIEEQLKSQNEALRRIEALLSPRSRE